MKIYTITFCNTTNVGAALQEYALQKYLRLKGNDVKVVNYIPKVMNINSVWAGVVSSRNIKELLKAFLLLPLKLYRKEKYIRFAKKYIFLTPICREITEIEKLVQPDEYIVGSDQIWNDDYTEWDRGYFLQFETSAKKFSYAASAGKDEFTPQFLKKLKIKTQAFDRISVREEALQKAFISIGVPNVVQVLDPVFLLTKEHYETILVKPKVKNYILLYETVMDDTCILVARKLAKKHKLKIVQINRINNRYRVDKLYPCVSPTEFLGLVKYADYIVTNSFHAVAMSLILEKQFWVKKAGKLFSRMENLLKRAGLERRILYDSDVDLTDKIDYRVVNRNMGPKIRESKEFLDFIANRGM